MSEDDKKLGEASTDLLEIGGISSDARTADVRPASKRDLRVTSAPDIPGYKLTSVLGEGGMGTVYAALQDSPHRPVAIKILHRSSEAAVLRFQTEAEVMARLDHPGIARILEAGEAGGHPFLAMERVEGKTLDDHVAKMPRNPRLELFVSICEAVHHAHVKGVIHRDLKPSNVMVRADGRAVVLDFGVARLADHASTGPTRAGELIGTPLYMSPEQARLRPDEVDARTDVYTLGVILYELACNELPYASPRELPLPALSHLICEEPPIPLSKRDPELRGDLEAIVAKALAKAPRDRYQSVAALGDDVRAYLDGRSVSVRLPGAVERTRRFVRRRPLVAGAVALAAAGVVAFASIVTVLWLDARAARRATEQARARTELARAELQTRHNELVLRQARSAIARDPTEALAWLATLDGDDFDARIAATIADEARARGAAHDVLRGHSDEVHWVAPVKGGFVSAGYDGRVVIWDPSPRVIYTLDGGRAHMAVPSPDGERLAIGGDVGRFVIASRTGAVVADFVPFDGEVQHVAWSPDGKLVAAATDRGQVWVIALATKEPRQLAAGHVAVEALAFATSGDALVAGDDDGVVRVWKASDGTPIGERNVGAAAIDVWSDGAHVRIADGNGVVHDASLAATLPVRTPDVATNLKLKRALFSADGEDLLAGGVGGEVVQVIGTRIKPAGVHQAQVRSLARSADNEWFASGGDDGSLLLHHASGRSWPLRGHAGRIRHLAFDGAVLLSADSDGVVRRWELASLGTAPLLSSPLVSLTSNADAIGAVDESGNVFVSSARLASYLPLGRADGRITDIALVGAETVVTGGAPGRH